MLTALKLCTCAYPRRNDKILNDELSKCLGIVQHDVKNMLDRCLQQKTSCKKFVCIIEISHIINGTNFGEQFLDPSISLVKYKISHI